MSSSHLTKYWNEDSWMLYVPLTSSVIRSAWRTQLNWIGSHLQPTLLSTRECQLVKPKQQLLEQMRHHPLNPNQRNRSYPDTTSKDARCQMMGVISWVAVKPFGRIVQRRERPAWGNGKRRWYWLRESMFSFFTFFGILNSFDVFGVDGCWNNNRQTRKLIYSGWSMAWFRYYKM